MAAFFRELKRRQVYQTAALYVIGAWGIIQVADVLFPAWNIPQTAKQFLVLGAILGAPFAVFFGWRYDLTTKGIGRTPPVESDSDKPLPLTKADAPALSILAVATVGICYWMASGIMNLPGDFEEPREIPEYREGSIAVIPFANISSDPENDYFCDGISEEMLLKLGEYRDLQVLGRASSFQFKGSALATSRISELLGVQYLLLGSVRKDANQLRIAAQLIDSTGFQVWEQSFDRELTSVFAIQDEIATAVAKSLASIVTAAPVQLREYEPDIDAYQDFLLGRELFRHRESGWQERSTEFFESAIERDPAYAQPYAGLAAATILGATGMRRLDDLNEARMILDRAFELNPDLPEAHAVLGLLEISGRPADNVAAEAALRRALELDPRTYGASNWLAIALNNQGRYLDAQEVRLQALDLDPLDVILNVNVGLNFLAAGDFTQAENLFIRLLDLPGAESQAYGGLRGLYANHGKYDQMLRVDKQRIRLFAEATGRLRLSSVAGEYAILGMWNKAESWQELAEVIEPGDLNTLFGRSYVYRLQGRYDDILAYMTELTDEFGLEVEQLPFWAAQVFGASRVVAGEYDEGIKLLEKTFDLSQPMPGTSGGGAFGLSVVNVLGWGYRMTGDLERAAEAHRYVIDQVHSWRQAGLGGNPALSNHLAIAMILNGDTDGGLRELADGVERGFRDYYFVWNDPMWDVVRDDPRFLEQMAIVKVDIDAMAERVRIADSEDDFEAWVNATRAGQSLL